MSGEATARRGRDIVEPPQGTSPLASAKTIWTDHGASAAMRQRATSDERRATSDDNGRHATRAERVERRVEQGRPCSTREAPEPREIWAIFGGGHFFFGGSDFGRLTIQAARVDSAARGADEHGADPGGSSNGRTQDSGSCYQGSNPCPPARPLSSAVGLLHRTRSHRLAVRTSASHAGNAGSIPAGIATSLLASFPAASVWTSCVEHGAKHSVI